MLHDTSKLLQLLLLYMQKSTKTTIFILRSQIQSDSESIKKQFEVGLLDLKSTR